jgi:hypothetical protein
MNAYGGLILVSIVNRCDYDTYMVHKHKDLGETSSAMADSLMGSTMADSFASKQGPFPIECKWGLFWR